MKLPRLYCITDGKLSIERALKRGVKLVQLRNKDLPTKKLFSLARKLQKTCKKHRAKLLINSRSDIALSLNLDGVHLPQQGSCLSPREARLVLGPRKLIGVSAHSLREAIAAQRAGADFITFGPVFATPSKKKYGSPLGLRKLEQVCRKIKIPVYALGGLSLDQLPLVRARGAHGLAAIRAFLKN